MKATTHPADARPTRTYGAELRRTDTAIVIWRPGDEPRTLSVNETAAALWELCDGETTVAEMAEAVAELTSQSLTSAWNDVTSTLARFEEAGFLVSDPPALSPTKRGLNSR